MSSAGAPTRKASRPTSVIRARSRCSRSLMGCPRLRCRQRLKGRGVPPPAQPAHLAHRQIGEDGVMAELLSRVDVRDGHLHERQADRRQGIAQGKAVVGESAGVDHGTVGAGSFSLQEVDDLALAVRLEGADISPHLARAPAAPVFDLGEGEGAVPLRLSLAEGVQVRPVDQQYPHLPPGEGSPPQAAALSTALDYRTPEYTRVSAAPL